MATAVKSPLSIETTRPDTIEFFNFLVYGESGVGKTRLIGSAQLHVLTKPMLLLDVEGGTITLRKQKDIDVVQVRSIDQIVEVHNDLRVNNNGYYKSVAIDSLSELADLDMRDVMRKLVQDKPGRDPDVPDKREWGIVRTHMRKIVRAYKDLEMNTFMTALLRKEKDDTTGAVTFYPSLAGQLKTDLPGFFDVVGYMYTKTQGEEIIRRIQFQKSEKITAKDRFDAFDKWQDNVMIPDLMDILHKA